MQRLVLTLIVVSATSAGLVQGDDSGTIPEVVYIDPAPYLPEGMDQITQETLENVSLRDLAAHIEEHYGFGVLLLENDLADEGVDPTDEAFLPAGLPLYQALDVGLEDINGARLTWIMEDGLLKITSYYRVGDTRQLQTFDISHLRFDENDLELLQQDSLNFWALRGGAFDSKVVLVGDTLTVRHLPEINREIAVLIDALSREGRIIRVEHPPHHQRLVRGAATESLTSRSSHSHSSRRRLSLRN